MLIDASYLREIAQKCVVLARQCPHLLTSRALEALSIEPMGQAAELEKETSLFGSANGRMGSN